MSLYGKPFLILRYLFQHEYSTKTKQKYKKTWCYVKIVYRNIYIEFNRGHMSIIFQVNITAAADIPAYVFNLYKSSYSYVLYINNTR